LANYTINPTVGVGRGAGFVRALAHRGLWWTLALSERKVRIENAILARPFSMCFLPTPSFAGPLVYSFFGQVSQTPYDGAGIVAEHGISVGDPVAFRFLVDFGRDGYYLLNNGSIEIPHERV
jgi:hypothetical protein